MFELSNDHIIQCHEIIRKYMNGYKNISIFIKLDDKLTYEMKEELKYSIYVNYT